MTLTRNVGLKGLKYRGGSPMLVWILHRIGGLCIVIFVSMHVISSFFMQQVGSDVATVINTFYESVYFQLFIYFFVLFHAINGLRIILMDFWPKLQRFQREMIWIEWIVFIPVYGLTIFIMIQNALKAG
jgi:succinate dehydrogenase / fumarate reductase, cytochrome b subunit